MAHLFSLPLALKCEDFAGEQVVTLMNSVIDIS